jgi:hypothetical protein
MPNSSSDNAATTVTVVQPATEQRTSNYPEVQYRARAKVIKADIKEDTQNKLTRLIKYLAGVQDQKFTGYIKVNFTQGSIGRIERFEEILSK